MDKIHIEDKNDDYHYARSRRDGSEVDNLRYQPYDNDYANMNSNGKFLPSATQKLDEKPSKGSRNPNQNTPHRDSSKNYFSCLRFANGYSYCGTMLQKQMSGIGLLKMTSYKCYIGDFKENQFDGIGYLKLSEGYAYLGEFLEGTRHGIGKTIQGSLSYLGEHNQDQVNGIGEIQSKGGIRYRGNFTIGIRKGYGETEHPERDYFFQGMFAMGKKEGFGIEKNKNLSYYGQYKNGYKHGVGCEYLDKKLIFIGSLFRNNKTGFAHCILGDNKHYDGLLEDGLRHGVGKTVLGDICFTGEYQFNKRHGFGRLESKTMIYVGNWIKGERNGMGFQKSGDGRKRYGFWKGNKMNGFGYEIFEEREYKGQFVNGLYHGNAILNAPGKEEVYAYFEEGKLVRFIQKSVCAKLKKVKLDLDNFFSESLKKLVDMDYFIQKSKKGVIFDPNQVKQRIEMEKLRFDDLFMKVKMDFQGVRDKFDMIELRLEAITSQAEFSLGKKRNELFWELEETEEGLGSRRQAEKSLERYYHSKVYESLGSESGLGVYHSLNQRQKSSGWAHRGRYTGKKVDPAQEKLRSSRIDRALSQTVTLDHALTKRLAAGLASGRDMNKFGDSVVVDKVWLGDEPGSHNYTKFAQKSLDEVFINKNPEKIHLFPLHDAFKTSSRGRRWYNHLVSEQIFHVEDLPSKEDSKERRPSDPQGSTQRKPSDQSQVQSFDDRPRQNAYRDPTYLNNLIDSLDVGEIPYKFKPNLDEDHQKTKNNNYQAIRELEDQLVDKSLKASYNKTKSDLEKEMIEIEKRKLELQMEILKQKIRNNEIQKRLSISSKKAKSKDYNSIENNQRSRKRPSPTNKDETLDERIRKIRDMSGPSSRDRFGRDREGSYRDDNFDSKKSLSTLRDPDGDGGLGEEGQKPDEDDDFKSDFQRLRKASKYANKSSKSNRRGDRQSEDLDDGTGGLGEDDEGGFPGSRSERGLKSRSRRPQTTEGIPGEGGFDEDRDRDYQKPQQSRAPQNQTLTTPNLEVPENDGKFESISNFSNSSRHSPRSKRGDRDPRVQPFDEARNNPIEENPGQEGTGGFGEAREPDAKRPVPSWVNQVHQDMENDENNNKDGDRDLPERIREEEALEGTGGLGEPAPAQTKQEQEAIEDNPQELLPQNEEENKPEQEVPEKLPAPTPALMAGQEGEETKKAEEEEAIDKIKELLGQKKENEGGFGQEEPNREERQKEVEEAKEVLKKEEPIDQRKKEEAEEKERRLRNEEKADGIGGFGDEQQPQPHRSEAEGTGGFPEVEEGQGGAEGAFAQPKEPRAEGEGGFEEVKEPQNEGEGALNQPKEIQAEGEGRFGEVKEPKEGGQGGFGERDESNRQAAEEGIIEREEAKRDGEGGFGEADNDSASGVELPVAGNQRVLEGQPEPEEF